MKTSTIIRIIITILCVALVLCVLLGKSVLHTGMGFSLSYSYIDMITGVNEKANSQFVSYLLLLLISTPICIVLVWIRKRLFAYIAAILSMVIGLYRLTITVSWYVKNSKNITEMFSEGFYNNMLIFLPLIITVFCFFLAWQISNKKDKLLET